MKYGSLIVFPTIPAGGYTGNILQDGFALDKRKVIGAYVPMNGGNYVPDATWKILPNDEVRIQISDKKSTPFIDGLPGHLSQMVIVNSPNNIGMTFLPIEEGEFDRIQLLLSPSSLVKVDISTYPITLIYKID